MQNIKLYTEKDFEIFLQKAKAYWGETASRIVDSLLFSLFWESVNNPERNYNVNKVSQGVDWTEPPGHIGKSYKVIHAEGGANLLKYWWHDKPIVSISHPYEYDDIYKLYIWMGENGYNVNTAE